MKIASPKPNCKVSTSRRCLSAMLIAAMGASSAMADRPSVRPTRMPTVAGTSAPPAATPPAATSQYSTEPNAVSQPRRPAINTAPSVAASPRYLRSSTAGASLEIARRLLAQATQEYDSKAWMSAENTAWDAIRHIGESIDLANVADPNQPSAGPNARTRIEMAKHAITESRDFAGVYGAVDAAAIARMARSHQTKLIDPASASTVTANEATDRYLDFARVQLATIAGERIEAAQALDLLAAVYLGRADASTLPSETAICMRRAALQGQPNNASLASRLGMHLADVGLHDEACWALQHSLSMEFTPQTAHALVAVMQRTGDTTGASQLVAKLQQSEPAKQPQVFTPEIVELSPSEFASVSKSVMSGGAIVEGNPSPASVAAAPSNAIRKPTMEGVPASLASTRITEGDGASGQVIVDGEEPKQPGVVRRFFGKFKKPW
ncbi:hypothetical protein K227x_31760 [Rubripirellula lacrimiformis]|uniref:Tetratricopeptide repeat protein n=1 Tax=Rubripirellula lacrimiformis TaxID=1930273 RepID=A0A517NCC4_9BACT|nr:hypothetical protein [Rubripirellula lacrimiformis]QDT04779.1 hypothetical protein K227x_31760 [Rubripirellula lacrimiformis]